MINDSVEDSPAISLQQMNEQAATAEPQIEEEVPVKLTPANNTTHSSPQKANLLEEDLEEGK